MSTSNICRRWYECQVDAMSSGRQKKSMFLLVVLLIQGGVSGGFIDQETPLDKRTTTSFIDGSVYHLVMSDEFNVPNRSFTDGHDPIWTALDKPDDDSSAAGGGSQHFYNSSFVTTEDGMLKISTKIGKTQWKRYDLVKKKWKTEQTYFNSGMVQTWEKFCFTGGIVEVDVILPGDPYIGGLWPAIWMLGNLGRATYESSTNNIWPWSYDTCDRTLQPAQTISACNSENHFGLHPHQGRGATEIDIIEIMTGEPDGPLPSTNPPITLPYADMTLQVAPGVPKHRPPSGAPPKEFTWYEGLELHGNTSINPFFYGTYLGVTKPGEPVTRRAKQAFQADAVGAAHQITSAHFSTIHTFRLEWQPGPGGRLDWFTKGHCLNDTFTMEGDGHGTDWLHAYGIKDEVLKKTTGAQIPLEPTYLIINTAVSSTWGFPYVIPDGCVKCYDCDDPNCVCSLGPQFCKMLRDHDVAMRIDSMRVYQSRNSSAHVGQGHTLGCDPPAFPTRGWIKGHENQYMRNEPFSYNDKEPIKKVQRGGGRCSTYNDCGAHIHSPNFTATYEEGDDDNNSRDPTVDPSRTLFGKEDHEGRGICIPSSQYDGVYTLKERSAFVCQCHTGYTGPHCLAQDSIDDTESAYQNLMDQSLFHTIPRIRFSPFLISILTILLGGTFLYSCYDTNRRKDALRRSREARRFKKQTF